MDPYQPVTRRVGPPGDTVLTTFNLYNLFAQPVGRPPAVQRAKLALAIRAELQLPHILAVQEVETEALLQTVADLVNQASGSRYQAAAPPCSDRRGIRVGLLWDRQRVERLKIVQLSGPDVAAAFGPGSPSPGREPLVGIFRLSGQTLTVIVNHFKSDYVPEEATPARAAALLAASRAQRLAQAQVVWDFVNRQLATTRHALVAVLGDFNDEPAKPVGSVGPLAILTGQGNGAPLTNLLPARSGEKEYTFMRQGVPALLDHILVSPALLARCVAVQTLPFNAAWPEYLADDPHTACRASDHDPVEARFRLAHDADNGPK